MTFRADSYPYFDVPKPRVFAHRGLHTDHPENTRGAFAAALAIGVSHIETDVVASRDGIAMIAHDLRLNRLAGVDAAIGDKDAAVLADIDLGGEGFITLRQALTEFPEVRFNIDVKDERAIEDVVDVVHDTDAHERVLVTSFSAARRRAVTAALPRVASSASGTEFLRIWAAVSLWITPPLPQIQALQIPERVYGLRTVSKALVEQYHRLGLEVHVWTVNDAADMRRLLDLGVDGIVTDRADIAMDVIRSRNS
ncbi:MAG: hypothetical protein RLZ72_789 [Actinomycetota bacterium]